MATPLPSHLGATVARLRRMSDMSQEALAEKAHISLSTLTKIERGAIYFDIHGVMATNWERVFTELAKRYDLQPQEIEMAFWRYNDIVGRGHMSLDDFEVALAHNLRVDIERIEYREAYFAAIQGQPQVHALMRDLSGQYEIGLLSNIFPGFLDRLLEMGVVPTLPYAAQVESCEIGSVKPETAIYTFALAQTQTTAEHIMLVDDTHPNIDVAKRLGWQGYWFDEQHGASATASLRTMLLPS
jgi:FMN phosphatase YigB (HAD superfamily)